MKFQWTTLRKAFTDINKSKSGKICPEELKYYLDFWGIFVQKEKFQSIFNKFDLDGDGMISYKDFQVSIGSEMFP